MTIASEPLTVSQPQEVEVEPRKCTTIGVVACRSKALISYEAEIAFYVAARLREGMYTPGAPPGKSVGILDLRSEPGVFWHHVRYDRGRILLLRRIIELSGIEKGPFNLVYCAMSDTTPQVAQVLAPQWRVSRMDPPPAKLERQTLHAILGKMQSTFDVVFVNIPLEDVKSWSESGLMDDWVIAAESGEQADTMREAFKSKKTPLTLMCHLGPWDTSKEVPAKEGRTLRLHIPHPSNRMPVVLSLLGFRSFVEVFDQVGLALTGESVFEPAPENKPVGNPSLLTNLRRMLRRS